MVFFLKKEGKKKIKKLVHALMSILLCLKLAPSQLPWTLALYQRVYAHETGLLPVVQQAN